MNAPSLSQNQREWLGDVRYLGWTAHWPKQDMHTHTHTHTLRDTHSTVEFSMPLTGSFLSPDYMTPCPVAEYYSEVVS